MSSFMLIALKQWALEGYTQTDRHPDKLSYFNYIDLLTGLLRGPSASPAGLLGRFAPSGFTQASCSFCSRAFWALRSQKFSKKKCVSIDSKCPETRKNAKKIFTLFDPLRASRVARSSRKFSKKISVFQSTRNTLKRIEMQKKLFTPLTDYALRA